MCRLNQPKWKALDATDPRPEGEGAGESEVEEVTETNIWIHRERRIERRAGGREETSREETVTEKMCDQECRR